MAKDKKSFLLYADQQSVFKQLPDEIAGQLIKHIFSYVNDENPITDNLIINIAFEPIKLQLKRDLQKYESIRERNSANARMRWDAVASSGIPKDTKNADNDDLDLVIAESEKIKKDAITRFDSTLAEAEKLKQEASVRFAADLLAARQKADALAQDADRDIHQEVTGFKSLSDGDKLSHLFLLQAYFYLVFYQFSFHLHV